MPEIASLPTSVETGRAETAPSPALGKGGGTVPFAEITNPGLGGVSSGMGNLLGKKEGPVGLANVDLSSILGQGDPILQEPLADRVPPSVKLVEKMLVIQKLFYIAEDHKNLLEKKEKKTEVKTEPEDKLKEETKKDEDKEAEELEHTKPSVEHIVFTSKPEIKAPIPPAITQPEPQVQPQAAQTLVKEEVKSRAKQYECVIYVPCIADTGSGTPPPISIPQKRKYYDGEEPSPAAVIVTKQKREHASTAKVSSEPSVKIVPNGRKEEDSKPADYAKRVGKMTFLGLDSSTNAARITALRRAGRRALSKSNGKPVSGAEIVEFAPKLSDNLKSGAVRGTGQGDDSYDRDGVLKDVAQIKEVKNLSELDALLSIIIPDKTAVAIFDSKNGRGVAEEQADRVVFSATNPGWKKIGKDANGTLYTNPYAKDK